MGTLRTSNKHELDDYYARFISSVCNPHPMANTKWDTINTTIIINIEIFRSIINPSTHHHHHNHHGSCNVTTEILYILLPCCCMNLSNKSTLFLLSPADFLFSKKLVSLSTYIMCANPRENRAHLVQRVSVVCCMGGIVPPYTSHRSI